MTAAFAQDPTAINYSKTLIPNGAKVLIAENVFDSRTTVTLNIRGLLPHRAYGAHVHTHPCGPNPDDAGSHFEHTPDPTQPSVNPTYANPTNEIWLDFTTDAHGDATTASTVPWTFPTPHPGSVVIHATRTQTGPGKAGTAGARIGCVSTTF